MNLRNLLKVNKPCSLWLVLLARPLNEDENHHPLGPKMLRLSGKLALAYHINEFLRAMKMMRVEAMMKMAFFRASYAPTIFSLSWRRGGSVRVCVRACVSIKRYQRDLNSLLAYSEVRLYSYRGDKKKSAVDNESVQ